jgi:hypothetical protein
MEIGPAGLIIGCAGAGLTITVVAADVPDGQPELLTTTV